MSFETAGPIGGIASGLEGYMQGRAANEQLKTQEAVNQKTQQETSSAPLLYLQMQAQQDPSVLGNANYISQVNHYGQPFGVQFDPSKPIGDAWAKMDLTKIVNPTVWIQKEATKQDAFMRFAGSIMGNPNMPPSAKLKLFSAFAPMSGGLINDTELQQMVTDPHFVGDLQTEFSNKMQSIVTRTFRDGAQANDYLSKIKNRTALLPAQLSYYTARDKNLQSEVDWRSNRTTQLQQQLNETAKYHAQVIGARYAAIQQLGDRASDAARHQLRQDILAAETLNRKTAQSIVGDILNDPNNKFNPAMLGGDPNDPNSVDNLTQQYNDAADALEGMAAGLDSMPPYKNYALPGNTQQSDRKGTSYVPYSAGQKLKIVSGPNAGKYTYKGKMGSPDGSGLVPYKYAKGDIYQTVGP